jgi:tetratricopeptide (TPR) repeat protein
MIALGPVVSLFLLALAAPAAAPPQEAINREARISDLEREIAERRQAPDREGVLAALEAMARLDPIHPKISINLILFHGAEGTLEEAPATMDRLALPDGPGRTYAEGMLAFFAGKGELAAERFAAGLAAYESRDHAAGMAACHTALGIVHERAGRFDLAAAAAAAALVLAEGLEDRKSVLDILGNLVRIERRRGNPAGALDRQRQVLAQRVEQRDLPGQALSWNEIAAGLDQLGEQAGAMEAYGQAIAILQRLGDRTGQISSLRRRAAAALAAGQGAAALSDLEAARGLASALAGTSLAAEVDRQHAETLVELGRSREAEQLLAEIAARFRDLDEPEQVAATLTARARALLRVGDLAAARAVALQALALAEASGKPGLMAAAATEMGNVHLALGELTDAVVAHNRALELYRQAGDRNGERTSRNNLGAAHFELGDLSQASAYLEEALALAGELNVDVAVARSHKYLGVVQAAREDL